MGLPDFRFDEGVGVCRHQDAAKSSLFTQPQATPRHARLLHTTLGHTMPLLSHRRATVTGHGCGL